MFSLTESFTLYTQKQTKKGLIEFTEFKCVHQFHVIESGSVNTICLRTSSLI